MMKELIDIRSVIEALKVIAEFNALDLSDHVLFDGEDLIPTTDEMIEEFKFTGLSNKDFIQLEFWKDFKKEKQ